MDLRTKPSLRRRSLTIAAGATAVANGGLFDAYRITSLTSGATLMVRTDDDDENAMAVGMAWRTSPGFQPWSLLVFRNAGGSSLTVVYYVSIGGVHNDDRLILDSDSVLAVKHRADAGASFLVNTTGLTGVGQITTLVTGAANVAGRRIVTCTLWVDGFAGGYAYMRTDGDDRHFAACFENQQSVLPFPVDVPAGQGLTLAYNGTVRYVIGYTNL